MATTNGKALPKQLPPRIEAALFGRKSKRTARAEQDRAEAAIERKAASTEALRLASAAHRKAPTAETARALAAADAEFEAAWAAAFEVEEAA
jgi:hypothetical protein